MHRTPARRWARLGNPCTDRRLLHWPTQVSTAARWQRGSDNWPASRRRPISKPAANLIAHCRRSFRDATYCPPVHNHWCRPDDSQDLSAGAIPPAPDSPPARQLVRLPQAQRNCPKLQALLECLHCQAPRSLAERLPRAPPRWLPLRRQSRSLNTDRQPRLRIPGWGHWPSRNCSQPLPSARHRSSPPARKVQRRRRREHRPLESGFLEQQHSGWLPPACCNCTPDWRWP